MAISRATPVDRAVCATMSAAAPIAPSVGVMSRATPPEGQFSAYCSRESSLEGRKEKKLSPFFSSVLHRIPTLNNGKIKFNLDCTVPRLYWYLDFIGHAV